MKMQIGKKAESPLCKSYGGAYFKAASCFFYSEVLYYENANPFAETEIDLFRGKQTLI